MQNSKCCTVFFWRARHKATAQEMRHHSDEQEKKKTQQTKQEKKQKPKGALKLRTNKKDVVLVSTNYYHPYLCFCALLARMEASIHEYFSLTKSMERKQKWGKKGRIKTHWTITYFCTTLCRNSIAQSHRQCAYMMFVGNILLNERH